MHSVKIQPCHDAQIVRLPAGMRLDADAVRLRRRGAALILEPVPRDWAWLDALAGQFDDDAARAACEEPAQGATSEGHCALR